MRPRSRCGSTHSAGGSRRRWPATTIACEAILDASGPVDGLRILDLGCGKGRFSRALAARGARVVGLDLSPGMLAEAGGIHRVHATARRLPFGPRCFDGIIAVEMFEHLDVRSRDAVLLEARRVLRP